MPRPSATKMPSVTTAGCAKANPIAAPMNGAVQGEAITTASTPERTESTYGFFAVQSPADDGTSDVNSNTPDRLSANTKNSTARPMTTGGDCNWKPQP